MQVIHPQTAVGSIPPENYFLIRDDLGAPLGEGHTVYQFQPHLFPEAPVRIYFEMNAQPQARFMLLGALIARARLMRSACPNAPGSAYTCVRGDDQDMLAFYTHSGLNCAYSDGMFRFPAPSVMPTLPMNFQVDQSPLNTPTEQNAFLLRLQENNITHIDHMSLAQMMQLQHFHLLGLFMGGNRLVGEALFSGYGNTAELAAIYVAQDYRGQKLGNVLVQQAMAVAFSEGVTDFRARIITRSLPQMGLVRHFGAELLSTEVRFPELQI